MSTLAKEQLIAQIAALELEEHEVSARRAKMHERIAIFPSDASQQAERELSSRRRDLHRRIDAARAALHGVRVGQTADVLPG